MINTFEKATGVKVPHKIVGRREGDIEKVWANPEKANTVLGWKAVETLESSGTNSFPESCNDLNCRLNGIADDHDLTDLTDGQFEALKQIWNDGYYSGIAYAKSCVDKLIKKE